MSSIYTGEYLHELISNTLFLKFQHSYVAQNTVLCHSEHGQPFQFRKSFMMNLRNKFPGLKFKQPPNVSITRPLSITADASNVSCVKKSGLFTCNECVSFRAGFF